MEPRTHVICPHSISLDSSYSLSLICIPVIVAVVAAVSTATGTVILTGSGNVVLAVDGA
jgi:peptidoglycan/LPS O-acetylase OafA/YrhL